MAGIVRFERKRWGKLQHWPEMFRSLRWCARNNSIWSSDLQCLPAAARSRGCRAAKISRRPRRDPQRCARPHTTSPSPENRSIPTAVADWYPAVLPHRSAMPVHQQFTMAAGTSGISSEVKRKWPGAFAGNPQSAIRNPQLILLLPGARAGKTNAGRRNILPDSFPCSPEISGRAFCHHRRRRRPARSGEAVARAAPERCLNLCGTTSLPEADRVDPPGRFDDHQRHRPDARRRRATEPRTGPYGQLENVLRLDLPCSPCMKSTCHFEKPEECLRALSPALVFERVQKLLPPRA